MALLTKAEYAERINKETKYLSVYIKRGKVILTADGLIDDTNPLNIQFMKSKSGIQTKKRPAAKPESASEVADYTDGGEVDQDGAPPEKPKNKRNVRAEGSAPDKYDKRFDLETTEKEAKIKKIEVDSEILMMKQQKMLGKLIPTDVVTSLFVEHYKNITVSFKQAVDIFLTEVSKKAKLGRNEQAEMKGQLISIINSAVEDSITQSKKGIANIVQEYSSQSK